MERNLLTITLCLSINLAFSQQNTVSSGGDASGTGGSASYSIGQVDYINSTGTTGSVHQGVQQPYEFFQEVGLDENESIVTSIYPNPGTDVIFLETDDNTNSLSYGLYDLNGKLLAQHLITENKTSIDVSSLAAGSYVLKISREQSTVETIKIIKH